MKEKIIFESDKSTILETSVFKKLILPNIILGLLLVIFIFVNVDFEYKVLIISVLSILMVVVTLKLLISKLLKLNTKIVNHITFYNDRIFAKFRKGNEQQNITLPIHSTEIKLIELRDHKSFFEGVQIKFLNKNRGVTLKLLDADWNYHQFERIFFEFKKRKNEDIFEDEKMIYEHLQVINRTNGKS